MAHTRWGFTLLELLVVIALMFVLITIAIVAFSGVRAGADRTASLNALRQMSMGFNAYANEHRGRFMPGYLDAESMDGDDTADINVVGTFPSGVKLAGRDALDGVDIRDISSWVWRLSPYVDDGWEVFYEDYRQPALVGRLRALVEASEYGPATASGTNPPVSEIPSFGMNSIFIGGDSAHGGPTITDLNPWNPASANAVLAAMRLTDVKNPARVILFGASQRPSGAAPSGSAFNVVFGSPELRAPLMLRDSGGSWSEEQWHLDVSQVNQVFFDGDFTSGGAGGAPIARHGGGLVPIGMLDGSVQAVPLAELNGRGDTNGDGTLDSGVDALMSRWSPHIVPPIGAAN